MIVLADGLHPSNEQAREWARDELSRSEYRSDDSSMLGRLADSIGEWFARRFADIVGSATSVPGIVAIVVAVLVLAAVVYLLRFVRRTRTRPPTHAEQSVLGASTRSGKELRRAATELLAAGDADGAVREAMRALTRRGFERQLLDDAPSLTAHEVSVRLAEPFPAHRDRLTHSATLFDAVVYGGRRAAPEEAQRLIDLEAEIDRTHPRSSADDDGTTARALAVPR
ncbi:hypothetical protein GCM10009624_35320 [Gordonia sinesedis]